MVGILKDKSLTELDQTDQKFLRGERLTTKQQREMYQERINTLLSKQINAHIEYCDEPNDESDYEQLLSQSSPLKAPPQMSDFMVTSFGITPINKIQDIKGYEKLLAVNQTSESYACKVVRRVIKSLDDSVSTVKVEYTSDPKAVKKFMKRKQAYLTRRVVSR